MSVRFQINSSLVCQVKKIGFITTFVISGGLDIRTTIRQKELDQDFQKLFKELEAEGYFEPSIYHVIIRLLDSIALVTFTLAIFVNCDIFASKLLATVFVGFAFSRLGWLQHEGGHRSLTGNSKTDRLIQDIATG